MRYASQGQLVEDKDGKTPRYRILGIWNKPDPHTLEITELPIGVWTQGFKKFLETLLQPEKKRQYALVKVGALPSCASWQSDCSNGFVSPRLMIFVS